MKKHTHTTIQQWPGAYLLHRCCNNYCRKVSELRIFFS